MADPKLPEGRKALPEYEPELKVNAHDIRFLKSLHVLIDPKKPAEKKIEDSHV